MRHTDDLGDEGTSSPAARAAMLTEWRSALQNALDNNEFAHPLFVALVEIVQRYDIPAEYLFMVIDGVCMDCEPIEFATFDELAHYCNHVAGAVGLCCIHIWGFHDERAKELALHCGLAFQLTNILRDLKEDAKAGRIYLPNEDLQRFGYHPQDLQAGKLNASFKELMAFEVARTRVEYEQAEGLYDCLEQPGKPILAAMLKIYGSLLDAIEQREYDVFSDRIRLPKWKKLYYSFSTLVRH